PGFCPLRSCGAPRQGIVGAFIEAADIVAAVPLLVDFQTSADQKLRRNVFHGKTDGLRGLRESLVAERLPPRYPPTRRKQLGRGFVVKFAHWSGLQIVPETSYTNTT